MLTTLLDLELSNGDKMKVIPKDIQIDPVKDNIIHIDLLRLSGDSRVSVEIQVNFVGENDSPGIKTGGVLTVTRYSVELDCPALSIPESIDVDISNLEMGESVKLSDVNLPEDVNPVITDRDITIASVTAPVEEIEEEIIEEASEEDGSTQLGLGRLWVWGIILPPGAVTTTSAHILWYGLAGWKNIPAFFNSPCKILFGIVTKVDKLSRELLTPVFNGEGKTL